MQCRACQRENRPDARFCDGCGAALARVCAGCERELRAEARFCDGCGRAVAGADADPAAATEPEATAPRAPLDPRVYTPRHLADRILTQRSSVEGERKHVTVLFADLADSTPLTAALDAEEVHALMDRAFQTILDEVHRYEGTVNQFLGDGVMALFGAPLALEDAPRRAVHAALAIQRALPALDADVSDRHGLRFRMRIGLHSGPVVVGRIGDDLRMDYTAVGDTTHLADRLQQRAEPGHVVISDATRGNVEGYFELEDLGAARAKGFADPVRAFAVRGESAASSRIEAAAQAGLTPFIARDGELGALQDAFANARDGRGQVALVVGEAGIGKSRLLYEFQAQLAGERHSWLEGRCSAYGSTTAFHAVSDSLRRFFGIQDRDDEHGASARLQAGVAVLGDDLAWTLPFLRGLVSLPIDDPEAEALDGKQRRSETVRALQALLMRLAEKSPLVYAVEDLHWIDAASEELLIWLVDAVPASRVLILLTCRPGYLPPFGERSYLVRLPVRPLSSRAMSAMAGSLVPGQNLPGELLDLVSSKAEGNPFFVEEILKSLTEEGVLSVADGRVTLQRELGDISVPDSIHDVLMARLDRLPQEPKRAIQVASVIGREFALRLLAAVREAGDQVQSVVSELRSLELIYEKAAHPELAFMFKHALTHDVAYDSILQSRRKALHRLVGTAIEELYADRLAEHYEALAHHFERAEEWDSAFRYHVAAAERAAHHYANRSAAVHLERAVELSDRLAEPVDEERMVRLLEHWAGALATLSEFERASVVYRRAAAACSDLRRRARNLARASSAGAWGHLYDEVDAIADEAIEVARRCGDTGSESIALNARGLIRLAARGPAAADADLAVALARAEESGDAQALVPARSESALTLEMRGHFREAIAVAETAVGDAAKLPSGPDAALSQWVLGLALTATGEYGRAVTWFREGLAQCERCGDRALTSRLLNSLGWLYSEVGADDLARHYNTESASMARYLIDRGGIEAAPEVHANATINLANNWTALGETGRALDLVEPVAESVGRPGEDPWNQWRYGLHASHALARVALASGEPEVALRHVESELAGARQHGLAKLEARGLELRARCLVVMDRRDEAREVLAEARSVAASIGYPPVLWRADSLDIELARRSGQPDAAARAAAALGDRTEGLAAGLEDDDLRRSLLALGRRLMDDPMGAHR